MELEKIEASMQNYFALIEQSDFNQAKESSNDLLNALKVSFYRITELHENIFFFRTFQ